jgi:hypothetical protein
MRGMARDGVKMRRCDASNGAFCGVDSAFLRRFSASLLWNQVMSGAS